MEIGVVNYKYPRPLATYEAVINNRELFKETLEALHKTMGSKYMVPTIGGKELDLHRLFVEVTSRGGLKQIITDKRWKDVTSIFQFPSSATNASFILRKYYISLLHHYEQIYLFGAERLIPLPGASLSAVVSSSTEHSGSSVETQPVAQNVMNSLDETPQAGSSVIGVIDGKFDHGYLVTVNVGSQKLKGVLYHVPGHSSEVHVSSGAHNANTSTVIPTSVPRERRRRRKKWEMKKRDPSLPKPNRSGYNFFFAEQHARLKPLHPGKDRDISRMIGELWNNLNETEKSVYQDMGVLDKERYRAEMEQHKERMKAMPINAIPLQQRAAMPGISNVVHDAKTEASNLQQTFLSSSTSSEESEADVERSDASLEAETGTESGYNLDEHRSAGEGGFEFKKRENDAKVDEAGGPCS